MPFLSTSRLTFHYRQHGDEGGLPMLLLHGSFGSGRWWERFLDVLPKEILAVAPDLRGCGRSEHSDHGYAIQEQAEDIAALVEALGWRDFDLVAHSSSAAIAVEYALAHQEKLASLILINPAPLEGVTTPPEGLRLLQEMRSDRALLARGIAAMMVSFDSQDRPSSPADRELFAVLVEDAAAMAPAAFTATAVALAGWNRFADAQRLTLPSLVVWGDRDEIVQRDAVTRTLIAIPGANNLEILRGVGHSPMIEAPLRLAERIIEFLSQEDEEPDNRFPDIA